MKIPRRIKAGAHTFRVTIVPDYIITPDGGLASGETNHSQGTIRIVGERLESAVGLTFFHELCHIAFHKQGLQTVFDNKTEEMIIDNLANGLYDLLVTNKLLSK